MSGGPGHHDIDVVVHGLLAIGVIGADIYLFLFLIPMLFDLHRTEYDLASLVLAIGALSFSYLAGRYIWRSAHNSFGGGDR